MIKRWIGISVFGLLIATGIWAATDKRESAHIFCFIEQLTNGTDYSCFHAQDSFTGSVDFTLPDGDGNSGQAITTDGAGTLSWSDAGGGGTGINFIADSNDQDSISGENTVGNWLSYDDGASAVPVNGTGGSPAAVTCVRTTTSTEILNGVASIELAKSAADGQGEGCAIDFKIPIGYRNSRLAIQALLMTDDTNYDTGDVGIWLYNVDSTALVTLEKADTSDDLGRELPFGISGNGDANIYYFTPTNDTDDDYRLIFHVTTTDANAWDVGWDDISVGPAPVASGAIVGGWEDFTPTGDHSTNTTYSGRKRRVSDTLEADITMTYSGAPDSTDADINIPDSLHIDPESGWSSGVTPVGHFVMRDDNTATTYVGDVIYLGSNTQVRLRFYLDSGTRETLSNITATSPITIASDDSIHINFKVPIAEWSGSGNVGQQSVEFAYNSSTSTSSNTTDFAYGSEGAEVESYAPSGTSSVVKRIRFLTPQITGEIVLLIVKETNRQWAPLGTLGIYSFQRNDAASNFYGMRAQPVSGSDTDWDVRFYQATGAGTAWSAEESAGTRWVMVKGTPAAIMAELAGINNAGLVTIGSGVVYVNTGNGHGSTNSVIRIFSNTVVNTGSGITYATDAADGDSFTITEDGLYSITYGDRSSTAADDFGISLNSSELTTGIGSLTNPEDRLGAVWQMGANQSRSLTITLPLSAGDVIRAHTNSGPDGSTIETYFTIRQLFKH